MRSVMVGTCVFVAALAAVAVAGGDMDDAKRKVAAFDKEYEALRKLTPEETRKIVTAVCEAEEAERKDVSKEAGRRAKEAIASKYKDLEKRKDEASRPRTPCWRTRPCRASTRTRPSSRKMCSRAGTAWTG